MEDSVSLPLDAMVKAVSSDILENGKKELTAKDSLVSNKELEAHVALNEESAMDPILEEFLSYEKGLSVPDYIKRFYQIRLEQEALRCEPEFSCRSACNPIHFARNRYRDILPYDRNRVGLSESDDNPDGYINASFIQLPGGRTNFVAAQAPLPSTLDEWGV